MSVFGPPGTTTLRVVAEEAAQGFERRTRFSPRNVARTIAVSSACLALSGSVVGAIEICDSSLGPHTEKVKNSLVRTETIDTYRTASGGYRTVDHVSNVPEYTTRDTGGTAGGFFLFMGDIMGGTVVTLGALIAGPDALENRIRRMQQQSQGEGVER